MEIVEDGGVTDGLFSVQKTCSTTCGVVKRRIAVKCLCARNWDDIIFGTKRATGVCYSYIFCGAKDVLVWRRLQGYGYERYA